MNEMENSNKERCKTSGTAVTSSLDPTSEQRLTCFRDILDLVLQMSDEEWKAVSRDMAKEVTRVEFAAASTKIVTMVSSAVVRRLLTAFSESFGTEAIVEANDKLMKTSRSEISDDSAQGSPTEASDVICHLAQRTVAEVKGAMLEAIRSTALRASRSVKDSAPAEDPLSQLEDLSITCTNEICDKILALYHAEQLDRPEGEKRSLNSHEEVHGIINSLEEVVHRSSSWYTVSSASSVPQAEKPFSDQFMSKASHVVNEVLLKTEQKITASVSPQTHVSAGNEPEMNFLMETAKSTATEILQKLFGLLVQSLREHLSGVSGSDAEQSGAGHEQEILPDAQKIHTDIYEQEITSDGEQKQAVSEERESPLIKFSPESEEPNVILKSLQESAAAELFLEEATQAASEILVRRLSSDISLGLDSVKGSSSCTSLPSVRPVDLDRVVSDILNQVIRGVAQELDVTDMEQGSEAREGEAQGSDNDAPAQHQSVSGLEAEQSGNEFTNTERKPRPSVQIEPPAPVQLLTAVRNHLKGFFTSFSKSSADSKKSDTSVQSEMDKDQAVPTDVSGDDSIRELVKHFKKRKKKRHRPPLPHWDKQSASHADNQQSCIPSANHMAAAECNALTDSAEEL